MNTRISVSAIVGWQSVRLGFLILVLMLVASACQAEGPMDEVEPEAAPDEEEPEEAPDEEEPEALPDTESGEREVKTASMLLPFPPSLSYPSLMVAEELGYFAEEDLQVQTDVGGGSGPVIQQLVAANVDYAWVSSGAVIQALAHDPTLRVISCHTQQSIFSIVVEADSDVQNLDDLRGRVVGISEHGGGEVPLVLVALRNAGLEEGVDVDLLPIGSGGPATVLAIEGGDVDAYAGSYTDLGALEGEGFQFRDLTPDELKNVAGTCLVVRAETLRNPETRDIAIGIARAWTKGSEFMAANPDAALQISCEAVPENCVDMDLAQKWLEGTLRLIQPLESGERIGSVYFSNWETVLDLLVTSEQIDAAVDLQSLIAGSDVLEARAAVLDFDIDAVQRDAEGWQ